MVDLVQHDMHFSKRKKHRLAGFEDVILIQNGVEVTHEPQYVGFNEQWLNGPA